MPLPAPPSLARRASLALVALWPMLRPATAAAQDGGLVTLPSAHAVRPTLDRFATAVRQEGWVVFGEVDHAAAARQAGLTLPARTVVLFGNPRAGTGAMAQQPTLALDLPMRVLVWEDAAGRVFVTRSTGADIARRVFARHGITVPPDQQAMTEALLDRLVRQAAG
ncbi:DUF302 domain-containing protein [Roseomonas sp. AR75]|uniref:DUF302 domain-containing protein n=1 Tax=Roseomonas sp. AR75 TaxID=2562311 RepID=UPI0014856F4C|nr:DUF302 domain-containing protein [Roseomonas sp. AR75]